MMKKFISNIRNPAKIIVDFDGIANHGKRTIVVNDPNDQFLEGDSATSNHFVLFDKEDPVCGKIIIKPEKAFDHQGIKVELIGEIILYFETKEVTKFTALSKEVAPAGAISNDTTYEFAFKNVEKEFDSYRGINADLRYYIRVTIVRSMFSIVKEQEFWVQCTQTKPEEEDKGISMEVGLKEIVLLSIKYDNVFHEIKSGCIEGRLKFYLVNVKIDKAEVSIIRKETTGQGEYAVTEQEILKKFEVIDGTPAAEEIVPVRLYLSAIDAWKLTPTVENVNNKFNVKYFLHLALCDAKGRRFFKQREIKLWRKSL